MKEGRNNECVGFYYVIPNGHTLTIRDWEYEGLNEEIVNYYLKFGIEMMPIRLS